LIAAIRGDRSIRLYVLPQCVVGVFIAAYHTQLQAFPKQQTFCSLSNPCTVRYVWEFGFVSLPFMSLAAFCFVIAMVMLGAADGQAVDGDEDGDEIEAHSDHVSAGGLPGDHLSASSVHASDPERVL